jgi:hypothetical protein
LEADFYLIGIDASIKEGNPDRDMIKESEMIASNDPAIMLRSLMIDIHDFELNRLNDINHFEVMRNIEEKGAEEESKIHEKFRDNSDICMMKENLEYLEQCYSRYMELCRKKKVASNLVEKNVDKCKKEGFFGEFKNENEFEKNEEVQQVRIFSEMKGIKDVRKKTVQRWMEVKIKECEGKDYTIPRLGLRHYALVDKDLSNVYREFEETSVYANSLCPGCE